MAKFINDLYFDIPKEVLDTLPKDEKERVKALTVSEGDIVRFDPAEDTNECFSTLRVSLSGSDAMVDRTCKKMKLHIGDHVFASQGYETIHAQG